MKKNEVTVTLSEAAVSEILEKHLKNTFLKHPESMEVRDFKMVERPTYHNRDCVYEVTLVDVKEEFKDKLKGQEK